MEHSDKLEEYEVIPYELGMKNGIVDSIRQFRRTYFGFFNGHDHMLEAIMRTEMEPGTTRKEVLEYINEEYVTVEDAGMIHLFDAYDQEDTKLGPYESELMDELRHIQ